MTTDQTARFGSIEEVIAANEALGHCWFAASSMVFFGTLIETGLIRGRYFITSDDDMRGQDRRFTVREAAADGSVSTVGDLRAYETLDAARVAVEAL